MQNDRPLMLHDVPPIRLALLGAGLFAQQAHIPTLLNLANHFQISAIYSRTLATAQAAAALLPHPVDTYDNMDAVLAREDIQAVDILLPIHAMPQAIQSALQAGKHVLSEKPLAGTAAEGQALIHMADQHPHLVWMVAENWRYASAIQRAKEIIQSGTLGKLALFNWAIFAGMSPANQYYHTAWRRDNSYQGGFLLDGGVHFMAALRMVLGEVACVQAQTRSLRHDLPPLDTLSAVIEMQSGLIGTFAATYAARVPWSTALTIVGEAGVLELNRDSLKLTQGDNTETYQGDDGITSEFLAFATAISGQHDPLNDPREGFRDLALLEALLQAAETGQPTVPQPIQPS